MLAHLWVFLGISAVVIVVPGLDTAVVTFSGVILIAFGVRLALERR